MPDDAMTRLELCTPDPVRDSLGVVVSHDCDIANNVELEPNVEIIVGKRIPEVKGQFARAKNPRKLHVAFSQGSLEISCELVATDKRPVSKVRLADFKPSPDILLTPHRRTILQDWLATRYRRAAFPDAFQNRLKEAKLDDRFEKIMSKYGSHIGAVFFDLDDGVDQERRRADDLYVLDIYVVYTTDIDPDRAHEAATKAVTDITAAFKDKLYSTDKGWTSIELRQCDAISDEALSLKHATQMKRWRLEHMSLREEAPQPIIGEIG